MGLGHTGVKLITVDFSGLKVCCSVRLQGHLCLKPPVVNDVMSQVTPKNLYNRTVRREEGRDGGKRGEDTTKGEVDDNSNFNWSQKSSKLEREEGGFCRLKLKTDVLI